MFNRTPWNGTLLHLKIQINAKHNMNNLRRASCKNIYSTKVKSRWMNEWMNSKKMSKLLELYCYACVSCYQEMYLHTTEYNYHIMPHLHTTLNDTFIIRSIQMTMLNFTQLENHSIELNEYTFLEYCWAFGERFYLIWVFGISTRKRGITK